MASTPTTILPAVPAYEEDPAPIPIPKSVRVRSEPAPAPDREMDLAEPAIEPDPEPAPASKVAAASPPAERVPNNVIVFPGSPKPAAPRMRRSVRAPASPPLVNDYTGGRLDPNEIQKVSPKRIQNVWY